MQTGHGERGLYKIVAQPRQPSKQAFRRHETGGCCQRLVDSAGSWLTYQDLACMHIGGPAMHCGVPVAAAPAVLASYGLPSTTRIKHRSCNHSARSQPLQSLTCLYTASLNGVVCCHSISTNRMATHLVMQLRILAFGKCLICFLFMQNYNMSNVNVALCFFSSF